MKSCENFRGFDYIYIYIYITHTPNRFRIYNHTLYLKLIRGTLANRARAH